LETVPQTESVTRRQCFKLGQIYLETVTQTGSYSFGDCASNLFKFMWSQCLKLSQINLETLPQTGAQSLGNMSQTALIYFER